MSTSQAIAAHLPYLRRYARALTGTQSSGDAIVRATLEAVVADQHLRDQAATKAGIYAVFQRIYDSAHIDAGDDRDERSGIEATAQARLHIITPAHRQALLLTTLEDFSVADAAYVMACGEEEVQALVAQAVREIDNETSSDVLIIEDEPLISMQLEQLVESLGHRVTGLASTRDEALERVQDHRPGLVLADIQLADGSSGIDAVKDILAQFPVPVIFITAFPERLLTGERPEPTYLITKPFQEATVKAAISQAVFLGSTGRIEQVA